MAEQRLVEIIGKDVFEIVMRIGFRHDFGCPQSSDKVRERTRREA